MSTPATNLGTPYLPEIDTRFKNVESQANAADTAATALTTRVDALGNGALEPALAANTETSSVNSAALSISKLVSLIVSTAAGSRTLAAPTADGQLKIIRMATDGGDTTLALTNFHATLGTGSVATFDDVGDSIVAIAVASKWLIIGTPGCGIA